MLLSPANDYRLCLKADVLTYIRSMPEQIETDLTKDERAILACGLIEWGGPASGTDEIAHVLGFADLRSLYTEGGRIAAALRSGQPLSAIDWRRALVATELVFASDVVGSGIDWPITTGFDDEQTVGLLRGAQRKLARVIRSV